MKLQLPPILDFNYETNYGTLFDTRDGQNYQVVRINNQIWLAENFRYLPSKEKGDKYCNSETLNGYLEKGYGRFYDWDTAMNIAPEGWKLPSNKDFQELIDFIKKDNNLSVENEEVGKYLKSVDGWGWGPLFNPDNELNNDKYGFNAKPAGIYGKTGYYIFLSFWSSSEFSSTECKYAYCYCLDSFNNKILAKDNKDRGCGLSLRLVKNS